MYVFFHAWKNCKKMRMKKVSANSFPFMFLISILRRWLVTYQNSWHRAHISLSREVYDIVCHCNVSMGRFHLVSDENSKECGNIDSLPWITIVQFKMANAAEKSLKALKENLSIFILKTCTDFHRCKHTFFNVDLISLTCIRVNT